MPKDIPFGEAWKLENHVFVDIRSENEFAQDHIPGACNIPLLTNEERCQVGTAYHQCSPREARSLGLKFVSPKLPRIVEDIANLADGCKPVIYCWRGGMRSQALSSLLDTMHVPHYRLLCGYKGFRRFINDFWQKPFICSLCVLHGRTGVGKTEVLGCLQKQGAQVLDLEALAGNRGSVFGGIGCSKQPTQKHFESAMWFLLQGFSAGKPVFVEGESRRIGRLLLPDNLARAMREGKHYLLYDRVENRAARIIAEYQPDKNKDAVAGALELLAGRLGSKRLNYIQFLLETGDFTAAVMELLEHYYDPLYGYDDSPDDSYDFSCSTEDCACAARKINDIAKGGDFAATDRRKIKSHA